MNDVMNKSWTHEMEEIKVYKLYQFYLYSNPTISLYLRETGDRWREIRVAITFTVFDHFEEL